jgi:membrane-associated phospholipid phosphatase
MRVRRALLLPGLATIVLAQALGGQATVDSTLRRPPAVSRQDALYWGGGFVAAALLDVTIRTFTQANRTGTTNDIADVGNSLGHLVTLGPALVGTWLVGTITGKKSVADAALWAVASGALAGGVTAAVKPIVGRQRPPRGDPAAFHPFKGDHSFPSGHTSFAFAVASSLAHSTPDGWSDVAFYAAATLTGLSRINHNRHWASDVVAGAALGYLMGRQFNLGRRQLTPVAIAGGAGLSLTF